MTRTKKKKTVARKTPSVAAKAQLTRRPSRKNISLPEAPPQTKAYMSATQRRWFRKKLEQILIELEAEAQKTSKDLQQQERGLADEFDRAHNEFAFVVDLRENERISNLQEKINHALRLLETGIYGYCDDCSEQIGIQRMIARPVATKCIDCKQFQEKQENYAA